MNLERLPTSSDTKVKGLIYGNPGVGKDNVLCRGSKADYRQLVKVVCFV